jgi:16S rRNA (guanine966-N2)-methyltransferase
MKTSSNTLRIIAGKWRSRKLTFPDAEGLRPTADRVRETLFNWLQNSMAQESCLDLFAGSGACGIEALSRDASHVTFIDNSAAALAAIRSNLQLLGAAQNTFTLHRQDALSWLDSAWGSNQDPAQGLAKGLDQGSAQGSKKGQHYGIAFVDPPFAANLLESACQKLEDSQLLKAQALIYVESGTGLARVKLPKNWLVLKSKQAGAVSFCLCQRRAESLADS